jgi:two-component system, OmpR family, KDP operon response regulator KdpE
LRRSEHQRDSSGQSAYQFGNVEVDLSRHAVSRSGAPVHLTALEFRLLALLLANAGKVMTHRKLLAEVWGPGHTEDGHYLRIYVGRLRQKLEDDPSLPRHFRTEVGVGYRFIL